MYNDTWQIINPFCLLAKQAGCIKKIYCVVPKNIHTHPKVGHWKFQEEGGKISKVTIFKGKNEAKLEFLEG